MAWATIKIKDNEDGSIDFQAELSDPIDNGSLAHQTVVQFIEFADSLQNNSVIAAVPKRSIVSLDGNRLENSK